MLILISSSTAPLKFAPTWIRTTCRRGRYSMMKPTEPEARELVAAALKNHCYHEGGVTKSLQKGCKQHITEGNLNLFV